MEIDEWLEKPFRRLLYQSINNIFKLRKIKTDELCSNILKIAGEKINCNNYYCVTPMRVQDSIRNVIAHAGLTAVHRLVAFVFKDRTSSKKCEEGSEKCTFAGMCIAAPFPESMIRDLLQRYMLG